MQRQPNNYLLKFTFLLAFSLSSFYGTAQDVLRRDAVKALTLLGRNDLADTGRLRLFLTLSQYHIFKPFTYKTDLDSAEMFLSKASRLNAKTKDIELEGRILLLKCRLSYEKTQVHKNKEDALKAVRIFQKTGNRYYLAIAYLELLLCFDPNVQAEQPLIKKYNDLVFNLLNDAGSLTQKEWAFSEILHFYTDTKNATIQFNNAIALYKRLGNKVNELYVRKELANMVFYDGNKKKGLADMLEILKESRAINFPQIYLVTDLVGAMYHDMGDTPRSLRYGLETLSHLRTAADSVYFPYYSQRIMTIYGMMGMYEQYIEQDKKTIDYYIQENQLYELYYYVGAICVIYLRQEKPKEALNYILRMKQKFPPTLNTQKMRLASILARCYYALKSYDLALKYFKIMSDLELKTKDAIVSHIDNFYLGITYFNTNQYPLARKYLIKALEHWKPSDAGEQGYADMYKALYKIDSASGNYALALKYSVKYKTIYDSIYNLTKNLEIEKLQIAYETEKKKKDIVILTSNQKLQLLRLKEITTTRNWIIAAAALLLLLLCIIFNRYLLKQKNNRILEVKQKEIDAYNKKLQLTVSEKESLITEKEWLLKEVHHRVKNNLHTVICLLESQATYLKDDALKAFENSQHRIYAMSLIHQKLYQSDDIKSVDMALYLQEFIGFLRDSLGIGNRISFDLQIEPLKLGVAYAVPISLIINEAVTNSIKYAFPDDRRGEISVHMHKAASVVHVLIADNGIGIHSEILNAPLNSLGIKLINGLTEDIQGKINFLNDKGVKITIEFEMDSLRSSITV